MIVHAQVDSEALPDAPGATSGDTVALSGQDPFAGGSDPFRGAADPFGSSDPFGDATNPFGGGDDVASAAPSAPAVATQDPFGSASSALAAPQASSGALDDNVDFGALLSGGGDEPFGSAAAADDPFGSASPASPAASDPFGSAPSANSFAAEADGGFGGDANPFASGGEDPFEGGDSAFAGGEDPFGGGSDPFGAVGNPFDDAGDGFGGAHDTVVLPGGSGAAEQGDGLFGDESDEDSLFLATPSTSGAMFDEEDEDHVDSFGGGSVAPVVAVAASPSEAASSKSSKAGGIIAPMLLVAIGVVGADYMGFVSLGIGDAIKSAIEGVAGEEKKEQGKVVSATLVKPVRLDDSRAKYILEIHRLTTVSHLSPQDTLVRQQLVARLLDVYERFPGLFDRQPKYRKQLEGLKARLPIPARYELLKLLAESKLEGLEARLRGSIEGDAVGADDYGVAALGMFDLYRHARRKHALDNPGEFSDPSVDSMTVAQPDDRFLALARVWLDKALPLAASAPNKLKFLYYDARLQAMTGHFKEISAKVPALLMEYPDHNRLRLLLAGAYVELNMLGKAAELLRQASDKAIATGNKKELAVVYRVEAQLEAKRGRVEDQLTALLGVLKLRPNDELTTIRTARLQLAQKHAQESQVLLVAAKKRGMKSIAFEVALVDFWLWSNRTEDALEEIKVATKLYPDTIELLYLRGQIEDRQQHFATARDYFHKVIIRQPKHLRAITRLAQLQSQAGRHDDALMTLLAAVKRLGENEVLLEPMADELYTLKRMKEAREIYAKLLKKQPSNKKYLINAARIDMDNGEVSRALRYMRRLRGDGNLDQAGALQMAEALVLKKEYAEAARTIVPFAEKEPNDVEMNTLAGKALLDSQQVDLAKTFLERAHGVAQRQGGNSETLFHYGRLAFKLGRIKQGIARLQLAIKSAPNKPHYRYFLAAELFRIEAEKGTDAEPKGLGQVAVKEMKYLVLHASRFATLGKPLTYLDDVQRQLGFHYIREKRHEDSIPHLRASVKLHTTHVRTLGALGMALFQVKDDDAALVLRRVIKLSPSDPIAALYLGLIAQQNNNSVEALKWLARAIKSSRPEVVEGHFQIALIYRERRMTAKARKALKRFLRLAPKDHPFREEAASIIEDLRRS